MPNALISVRFTLPGLHYWPEAPHRRAYLSLPHRHTFGVEVATETRPDEPEIDCHDMLDEAKLAFLRLGQHNPETGPVVNFGPLSCEDLARMLGGVLAARLRRPFLITVSEDGESSAGVECAPPASVR